MISKISKLGSDRQHALTAVWTLCFRFSIMKAIISNRTNVGRMYSLSVEIKNINGFIIIYVTVSVASLTMYMK
jgi:hypothetical protein